LIATMADHGLRRAPGRVRIDAAGSGSHLKSARRVLGYSRVATTLEKYESAISQSPSTIRLSGWTR